MRWLLRFMLLSFVVLFAGALAYGASGWIDAARDAPALRSQARDLIAQGRGGDALGAERLAIFLKVEDPGFQDHGGLDLQTPGAGLTTITQALAKRLAFEDFQPGIAKLRQTTYALSLERHLTKDEILALALDRAEMGQGPEGWVTGFFTASDVFFNKPPAAIDRDDFLTLVAVLIAPGRLSIMAPSAALLDRKQRIDRLARGQCSPRDVGDVWLDGCAAETGEGLSVEL